MKWSIVFTSTKFHDPDDAAFVACVAEEAGFDALWAPEHIVVPAVYETQYHFRDSGRIDDQQMFPDPLVWHAYVAAHTTRIKLGTGVVILPQHNPLVLAKSVATLDMLSRGRVLLGVGVGWLREEFDALNVAFDDRGSRSEEYIDIMRRIWTSDPAGYDGDHFSFPPVSSYPKPHHATGVPVVIGGNSLVAARRAGRLGDGFFPAVYPTERLKAELPGMLNELHRTAERTDRDPAKIEITSGGARTIDEVEWFSRLGVHRMTITVRAKTREAIEDELRRFGDEMIAPTTDL